MTKSILFLFLVHTILNFKLYSVEYIDLGGCNSNEILKDGLNNLKNVIGDSRIVVLGEQVHGVGTEYENLFLMTKFLHEEMGFNVLIQEYPFFSYRKSTVLPTNTNYNSIRKSMYWPQAKAVEYNSLINYLELQYKSINPLYVGGFDPRIMHKVDSFSYIHGMLSENLKKTQHEIDLSRYLNILKTVLDLEYKDTLTTVNEKKTFLKNTERIIGIFESIEVNKRDIQLLNSLIYFTKNAWNIDDLHDKSPDRYTYRDIGMFENIKWYLETKYPNEKIIIRLHNGHAAKNSKLLSGYLPSQLIKKKPNLGTMLYDTYGDDMFFIGSTYYSGTYCKWDYKQKKIPTPKENSIEFKLHKLGLEYGLILLDSNQEYTMFFNEFNYWLDDNILIAPFGSLFDAILFIDEVDMPKEIIKEN